MPDLIIRGQRVVRQQGIQPGCVCIRAGIIQEIRAFDDVSPDVSIVEAGNDVVMAGLVDTHVHVNEPGRTEWEGFASATRSAAAGGVTTLFDMPLNSIPATTTLAALHAKRASAEGHTLVNVGFIGGVVPENSGELAAMYAAGIHLFKCFLVPSGVDEFPNINEAGLRIAMPILADLDATLLVHAELPEYILAAANGNPRDYGSYLSSRPEVAETEAIKLVIRLAEEFRTRVHIVHLSSADSIPLLNDARRRGVAITAETCPHYLTFAAEEIDDGRTEFKCAPPIRGARTREALWKGVVEDDIDLIVSDHSPCPPEMKALDDGDFFQAWGGIASLQLGLPAVWHQMRVRGGSIEMLAEKMCAAPARLAGLAHRKGQLSPGFDADIVIWNPDAPVDVDAMTLYHRHQLTPYAGRTLTGRAKATFVEGIEVFRDGNVAETTPGILISPDTYLPRVHD